MTTDYISFKKTGYFSELICDYLEESDALKTFYYNFPKLENFKNQIESKQSSFSSNTRSVLVKALQKQYKDVNISQPTLLNINALSNNNTFTVTTGHQLNLFTGPLYFLYKIASTINLAKTLKQEYSNYNFVPVYWMATEDHDFDEINYFNFKGKKVQWPRQASGAVGELSNEGLESVFEVFSKVLGLGNNAETLRQLFESAYLKNNNLADATRYLANTLFADYGLVILDANDKHLKELFIPFMKEELVDQTAYKFVTETSKELNSLTTNYKVQVNPREINLFYLAEGLRERIVFEDNTYKVINTKLSWSSSEIKKELLAHPERFSPNVIMRPLYQEVILPNLCYIGGGGELAYWLQLKSYFEKMKVTFPMLLLRNSVLVKTEKQAEKQEKLGLSNADLFLKQEALIQKKTKQLSAIEIDFSTQKIHLKEQFKELHKLAKQTDKSFLGAVSAQERKQIKGLEHLEKRLMKAQKRKLSTQLNKVKMLQNELFPNQSLQERNTNFSELYLEFGDELIPTLIKKLKPLKRDFTVLTI
ncbi:bacillithiol biosynthesis cysteine-adding enzyme BshC [Lacinutrix iliipiscaria]|uniref:Putative cysteine ligase BshC n=1 Tax=Lacinutrix iliipiscaria TaxID=1230532 RepID=A0ABW5WLY3_9FLAO